VVQGLDGNGNLQGFIIMNSENKAGPRPGSGDIEAFMLISEPMISLNEEMMNSTARVHIPVLFPEQ